MGVQAAPNGTGGGWNDFLRNHGPQWDLFLDRRSGRPALIQGQGIPWYPGAGNGLRWSDLQERGIPGPPLGRETLEALARDLLETRPELLGVDPETLRLSAERTHVFDGGRYALVELDQVVDEIPVERAKVFFRVNSGNVIQLGALHVAPVEISTEPSVSREAALSAVLAHLEAEPGAEIRLRDEGTLQLVPRLQGEGPGERFTGTPGTGYGHHLAWRFLMNLPGGVESWEGLVDAHDGKLLRVMDINAYAVVEGGVYMVERTDP